MEKRVVVTLTTIPSRATHVVETVQSIVNGTLKPDALYVNIPRYYKRFETAPDPKLIEVLERAGATVILCEDHGTLTKVIPILGVEPEPETLIVIIDDDQVYSPGLLEHLVKGHREFQCAVGFSGIGYPDGPNSRYRISWGHGVPTDILEGSSGMLVPRKAFDGFPDCSHESLLWKCDDYVYARLCDRNRVKKRVICYQNIGRFGDDFSSIRTSDESSQVHSLSRENNHLLNYYECSKEFKSRF